MRDPKAFTREREILERQVAHMARLVNDLLDVSRLARGKVQLERRRFELCEAVDRAVDMARPLLAQRKHTLDVTVPASGIAIDADIDRIVQVLSNLLTNAAKYTAPGGHVALVGSVNGDRAVIVCEDNCPASRGARSRGVRSVRTSPRAIDRREGGWASACAGAHLHRVARRNQFTSSRASRGPAAADLRHAAPRRVRGRGCAGGTAAPPSRTRRAVSILVVDDNGDACEMLRSALTHAGHVVATAGNGPEAMAVAEEFRPDVAILDIGLPGMAGTSSRITCGRRTHASAARADRLRPRRRCRSRRSGRVDAHCAKPVTMKALSALIGSAGPKAPPIHAASEPRWFVGGDAFCRAGPSGPADALRTAARVADRALPGRRPYRSRWSPGRQRACAR